MRLIDADALELLLEKEINDHEPQDEQSEQFKNYMRGIQLAYETALIYVIDATTIASPIDGDLISRDGLLFYLNTYGIDVGDSPVVVADTKQSRDFVSIIGNLIGYVRSMPSAIPTGVRCEDCRFRDRWWSE